MNIIKKPIAIGRLPNRSDSGPAIKLTMAAPIENADTLSWIVLYSLEKIIPKSGSAGTIITCANMYIPAIADKVIFGGAALII